MSEVDWVVNGVYAVYVVAPLLKNEFWLRILLTVTAAGFIVWGSMIDNGSVIFWNSLFAAISIFAIGRLFHERRSIELAAADGHQSRYGREDASRQQQVTVTLTRMVGEFMGRSQAVASG